MPEMYRKTTATLVISVLILCACQSLAETNAMPRQDPESATSDLDRHLAFISRLYEMDTMKLDAAYQKAHADFEKESSADNRLRLAWVLEADKHAHSNPWAARKHLIEALPMLKPDSELARFVKVRILQLGKTIHITEELLKSQDKLKALTNIEQSLETRNKGAP